MKIKNTTFIQRHIEKVVLGAAGGFLLVMAAYYLLSIPAQPFGVKLSTAKDAKSQNISDVPELLKAKADELQKKLKARSVVEPEDYRPPNYTDIMTKLRNTPVASGTRLPVVGELPVSVKDIAPATVTQVPYFLPRPPLPQEGRVVTGNVVLASGEDRVYVSMEGTFDQAAWYKRLLDEGKQRRAGEEALATQRAKQGLFAAGVYLEREQWDPVRRAYGERKRIAAEPCYFEEQAAYNTMDDKERDKAEVLLRWIKDNQAQIQRPGFPALDPESPLPLLREKPVVVVPETTVPGGFGVPGGLQGQPEVLSPWHLWGHDLTVQPGQKYRYRLIATTLNPLYNLSTKSLSKKQVEENAAKIALSPAPAEVEKAAWIEITIPANFHCFFIEAAGIKAQFEVWKVVAGNWVGQTFEVKVGDAIGSKQSEVQIGESKKMVDLDSQKILVDILDVPEPGHPDRKVKAALLMNADGSLETRYVSQDANSPDRKKVQNKTAVESAPEAAPADGEQTLRKIR